MRPYMDNSTAVNNTSLRHKEYALKDELGKHFGKSINDSKETPWKAIRPYVFKGI